MRSLLAAMLMAMSLATLADEAKIQIDPVWSRAAPAGHEAAPIAAEAAVHQSISEDGAMKMKPAGPLPIDPGKAVTLAPGGYHMMLTALKHSLNQGDRFPITLSFAKA